MPHFRIWTVALLALIAAALCGGTAQAQTQCVKIGPAVSATAQVTACGSALLAARDAAEASAAAKLTCSPPSPAQTGSACRAALDTLFILPGTPSPPLGHYRASQIAPGQCIAFRVVSQSSQGTIPPGVCIGPPQTQATVTVAATCGVICRTRSP